MSWNNCPICNTEMRQDFWRSGNYKIYCVNDHYFVTVLVKNLKILCEGIVIEEFILYRNDLNGNWHTKEHIVVGNKPADQMAKKNIKALLAIS